MSTNEPPAGAPGEPTAPPSEASSPPPSAAPPPPPPASTPPPAASAPPPPAAAAQGVPRPGELMDRFLARLIDGVIVWVAFLIINAVVGAIAFSGYRSTGEAIAFYAIVGIIETALALGYFGYLESSRGQTVGKQVMKLHTYGPDGTSNPTMEQAIKRNIYYAAPILLIIPVLGWVAYAVIAIGAPILIAVNINADAARRQHWFDKFAGGTQVMKIG